MENPESVDIVNGDKRFRLTWKEAQESKLLIEFVDEMLEDESKEVPEIPIPLVSMDTWQQIRNYLSFYNKSNFPIFHKPLLRPLVDILPDVYQTYVNSLNLERIVVHEREMTEDEEEGKTKVVWEGEFIHLIKAAHYLEIDHLYRLLTATFYDRYREQNNKEFIETLGFSLDFTNRESVKIRNHNKKVFENN